jgi:hypothetical protein
MAIQQLPINGESKIINGVSYVYTAANNSWKVGVSVPYSEEIVYSDSLFISGNGITFSDGSVQTTATALDVWVRSHANAAFSRANSGTTLAQAAFNVANNVSGGTAQDGFARNVANTAAANTIYTQGVDDAQNTRLTIIESINTTQNTNITIVNNAVQSAFNQANLAFGQANSSATTGKSIAMAMVFGG